LLLDPGIVDKPIVDVAKIDLRINIALIVECDQCLDGNLPGAADFDQPIIVAYAFLAGVALVGEVDGALGVYALVGAIANKLKTGVLLCVFLGVGLQLSLVFLVDGWRNTHDHWT
jgi:hypothetical protein